jgi:hypothetical protein
MQSTLNPAHINPHDVLEIAPDVVLVARAEEELSKLARDAKKRPAQTKSESDVAANASVPPVDTSFRATAVNDVKARAARSSGGRQVMRGLIGLVLAVCIGVAAVVARAGGDMAKELIATWIPQFAARSSPSDDPAAAETPSSPPAQETATAAAAPQPAPPVQTLEDAAAPASAASSPDQAQLLQSMARDLASASRELAALKANVGELKANQEQMSRDLAKVSEQNQRLKVSALPPRPPAAPARKPLPAFRQQATAAYVPPPPGAPYPPAQNGATYAPPSAGATSAPPQAAPAPYDPDAPRPPMPVR